MYNEEICTELSDEKAYCVWSITREERIVPASEWRIMRVGRMSLSADAFTRLKTEMEKACAAQTDKCDVVKMKQFIGE